MSAGVEGRENGKGTRSSVPRIRPMIDERVEEDAERGRSRNQSSSEGVFVPRQHWLPAYGLWRRVSAVHEQVEQTRQEPNAGLSTMVGKRLADSLRLIKGSGYPWAMRQGRGLAKGFTKADGRREVSKWVLGASFSGPRTTQDTIAARSSTERAGMHVDRDCSLRMTQGLAENGQKERKDCVHRYWTREGAGTEF